MEIEEICDTTYTASCEFDFESVKKEYTFVVRGTRIDNKSDAKVVLKVLGIAGEKSYSSSNTNGIIKLGPDGNSNGYYHINVKPLPIEFYDKVNRTFRTDEIIRRLSCSY
jgi:hypothetical protein